MKDQQPTGTLRSAFSDLGPIQIVVISIVAVIAVAGAVVTIVSPKTLPFRTYTTEVIPALTGSLAFLGIGKGIHLGLAGRVESQLLSSTPALVGYAQRGQIADFFHAAEADIAAASLPTDAEEASVQPPPLGGDGEPIAPPTPVATGSPPPAEEPQQVTEAPKNEAVPPSPEEVAAAHEVLARAGLAGA